MQIGDRVEGTVARNYPDGNRDSKGYPAVERRTSKIEGRIKSIDPNLYWGIEVSKEDGESEWFHKSSLNVLEKAF